MISKSAFLLQNKRFYFAIYIELFIDNRLT